MPLVRRLYALRWWMISLITIGTILNYLTRAMLGVEVRKRIEIRLLERRAPRQEGTFKAVADEIIAQPIDRSRERSARTARQHRGERSCAARVHERARVSTVPREQLVASLAREHHLHAARRKLRERKADAHHLRRRRRTRLARTVNGPAEAGPTY